MPLLKLNEIAAAIDGELLSGDSSASFHQFKIDSREVQDGDLFFCIVGPNNDGHQFIKEATEKGAKAVIISEKPAEHYKQKIAMIMVNETTKALQKLAEYARRKMSFQVIGITGSIGKTTTKEMTYAVLSPSFKTCCSKGNLNNLYGLPLSLLGVPESCDIAVLEMGMSYAGELKKLAQIADPDIGVLTGIRAVHLEHFRSIEEISEAKAELFHSLRSEAIAIVNGDDSRARDIVERFPGKKLSYGIEREADISAFSIKDSIKNGCFFIAKCQGETFPIHLSTFGLHNVYNALAALCICLALGGDIPQAVKELERFKPYEKRGVVWNLEKVITLIDDTYNSNPAAMGMILQSLKQEEVDGRKVIVFGDMLELGKDSPFHHAEVGRIITESGIDMLIGIGELSSHTVEAARSRGLKDCYLYQDSEQAARQIITLLKDKDLILVKGSRAMKMEVVIEKLLHDLGEVC